MKKIDSGLCVSQAWQLFKGNAVGLILLYLCYTLVSQLVSSLVGYSPMAVVEAMQSGNYDQLGGSNLASILSLLVYGAYYVGFMILSLRIVRGQASANMECIKSAYSQPGNLYLKIFITYVLVGILEAIGFVLCFLPGLFLSVRLGYACQLIYDNPELGVVEAIKSSWELTRGNTGSLLGLLLICLLICIAGFCLCCVGIIAAAPFTSLISTVAYVILHDEESTDVQL